MVERSGSAKLCQVDLNMRSLKIISDLEQQSVLKASRILLASKIFVKEDSDLSV